MLIDMGIAENSLGGGKKGEIGNHFDEVDYCTSTFEVHSTSPFSFTDKI